MKFYLAFILVMVLAGCSTTRSTSSLSSISIGMKKSEVVNSLGAPDAVRGSIKNKHEQVVEVWEYRLANEQQNYAGRAFMATVTFGISETAGVREMEGRDAKYWLTFVDGLLNKWGQAGDWRREADLIFEHRFR